MMTQYRISRLLLLLLGLAAPKVPCLSSASVPTYTTDSPVAELAVVYNEAMQPLVEISVADQVLRLVFDLSSGDTLLLVDEKGACRPKSFRHCYSYEKAEARHSLHVCEANQHEVCSAGHSYSCSKFLPGLDNATAHPDELAIDGLRYLQKSVEGLDDVEVFFPESTVGTLSYKKVPVRLLVEPFTIPTKGAEPTLRLFEGASGLLGASGPSLTCRSDNVWARILDRLNISLFALDFQPPAWAFPLGGVRSAREESSRVVLGHVNPRYAEALLWSQHKQTGDLLNDAMSEFLLYHPSVCGVDLLYNTSSNWLAVLDTSGPCLLLPPFIFDRLRAHVPMDCPFELGEPSLGRLCSPRREDAAELLPALTFQLEDLGMGVSDKDPTYVSAAQRQLELPLERLVFRNNSGHQFLCISRDDDAHKSEVDMLFTHISFGSLAVAAMYTVVDLESHRVGLASRGNASTESSNRSCSKRVTCRSTMQTYFPPQNVCLDPPCSSYLLMTLDEETRTCKWSRSVPTLFGVLLASLVVLDLTGHRLYQLATEKAGGAHHSALRQ